MLDKHDKDIEWFEKSRFGLFIHWSLFSATEGMHNGKDTDGIVEWIQSREAIPCAEYEKYTSKLSDEKFNSDEIMKLAKKAGIKYVVFTTKHHDGFSMFDTEYDDYSINKRCGVKRDVTADLINDARKNDIIPCLYYSQSMDFHEKNAMGNTWEFDTPENKRDFRQYFDGKCKFQVRELLTKYGKIGMLWFDVARGMTVEYASELRAFVKSIQPECIINGRLGGGKDEIDYFCMGDNEAPYGRLPYCAETAATINNTWGYKRNDTSFKTPKEIIELLCSLMSKGINLLLNIGPKPDGSLPKENVAILQSLEEWMKINSEAVYETKASPFAGEFSFGWVSQKNNYLYLYIREKTAEISIRGINNDIISAKTLLGENVEFNKNSDELTFNLKNISFGKYVTVIKVELDSLPKVTPGLYQQEKNQIELPCSECRIINSGVDKGDKNFDTAVERNIAEYENFTAAIDASMGEYRPADSSMNVSVNATVNNWFDVNDSIFWQVDNILKGEYSVYLYTATGKYQKWQGGHKIAFSIGENMIKAELRADVEGFGVNHRYFSETGSFIGNVKLEKDGKYLIKLMAEKINGNDPAGLSVTHIALVRK